MKQKIENLLNTVNRKGIDNVLKYLEESDFYTAPASTKYHSSNSGGLANHSFLVYNQMMKLNIQLPPTKQFSQESIILVGLLHDICKVNIYQENILKSGNRSEANPYKKVDKLPLGHGEKSAIILCKLGLDLTDNELLAIRWHMNAFDDVNHYKAGTRWNKLSIFCFIADYFVSQFLEE